MPPNNGPQTKLGYDIMFCCRERETTITLYREAMAYLISIIFIHLSMVTYMQKTTNSDYLNVILRKSDITMNLRTIDNLSTSRERFNSSNLSMPPSRLIYSSDQLVNSLCIWLCTNDHDSSPYPIRQLLLDNHSCHLL